MTERRASAKVLEWQRLVSESAFTPRQYYMEQGSKEWHGMRRGKVTGSNFAAAAGLNPYCSRSLLWRQVTGRTQQRDISAVPAVAHGNKYEGQAISAYSAVTGNYETQHIGMVIDAVDPWVAASPDGYAGEKDEHGYGKVYLEAKCPFGGRDGPRLYDGIPDYYMPQVQGSMGVTRRAVAHFFCYVPPLPDRGIVEELAVWEVPFCEEYNAELRHLMREFYLHVVNHKDPGRTKKPAMPEVKVRIMHRGPV